MQEKMTLDYWKSQLDERWLETMSMLHKGKDMDEAIAQSFGFLIADEVRLENSNASDFKRLVNGWLSKMPRPKKVAQKLNYDDL